MASPRLPLTFVDDRQPGITRRRMKIGWGYFAPDGSRITDRDEIDRLNRIGMPPAYEDCWFCPDPDGHLQATGIDARGRKQYRYHAGFRLHREGEKFDGCAQFGRLLPRLRKAVERDLAGRAPTRDRAVASVVRLLDLGAIRVGNESYAKENKSFGATTLRRKHAEVKGGKLKLRFVAKSGKLREATITDRALARFVRQVQDLPGQNLFQYVDAEGNAHPVGSADVNAYISEAMGEHYTAKHFRTWHASALAFRLLAEAEGQLTLKALMTQVADHLGNTPAIARKSYVHPAVVALVERQEAWRKRLKLPRATQWLSAYERGLVALIEKSPRAGKLLAAA